MKKKFKILIICLIVVVIAISVVIFLIVRSGRGKSYEELHPDEDIFNEEYTFDLNYTEGASDDTSGDLLPDNNDLPEDVFD